MNGEKSTHPGMLHQSRALWLKGTIGDAVHAITLKLNDFIALGEVTFTFSEVA